ncbi:hypothetical protein OEA41_002775 [Lepraria neglecta]|uniref:DUF7924 domain-containing protein n=1 Tax=Lepraria neglecta TaxID=209136 RepID=A0AAD9Z790_9LECA|nr:hypothetical protein OEA41_002775 [Lepraria neglecta]
MPSVKASEPHNRKRQRSEAKPETDFSRQPTAKRQKLKDHQRHQTPSSFWDNLSRQWLTRRTLREFDRRTVWPAVLVPPYRTGEENIDLAKLKRFARHGGPSLGDIRGSNRAQRPSNWAEINERLAQLRPSLSPSQFSEAVFETFQQTNEDALTENTVMSKAFPIIAGTADITSQEHLYFGNLKHLTDGSIMKAKPDFYDGARPAELNTQVREQLSEYIEPSAKKNAPCLPNFFTEAKGPDGSAPVCELQAMYDGAMGARGVHELRSYVGQETPFDNKAYTITSTYHYSGLLTIYTTHPTASESPTNPTEYRIIQLNSFAMTGNPETFRQGAGALRNARDWAKEKREELIAAANGKVPDAEYSDLVSSTQSFTSQPSKEPTRPESETSADELALDADTFTSSSRRAPVGARTKPPPPVSSNQRSKKTRRVNNRSGTGSGGSQVI